MTGYSLAELKRSGIYEIVNKVNGKRYVGSAVNLGQRWRQHRCELGKGRHNPHLQNAWRKHGELAFSFWVLEFVDDRSSLLQREQHYIDSLCPEYNCAVVAGSNFGVKFGEEVRRKMAAASSATWARDGYREKMSAAQRGKSLSEDHRANISAANTGRKKSPEALETARRILAERNKSPEHRALMSKFWSGRPKTDSQREKISRAKTGTKASEEHKQKVGEGLRIAYEEGRRSKDRSPEQRAKIGRSLAVLSDEQVTAIRTRLAAGAKHKVLSEEYGISQSGISNIGSRKTYRWVP